MTSSIGNKNSQMSANTLIQRGVAVLAGAAALTGQAQAGTISWGQQPTGRQAVLQRSPKTLPAHLRAGNANLSPVAGRSTPALAGFASDGIVSGKAFAASQAFVGSPRAAAPAAPTQGLPGGRRLMSGGSIPFGGGGGTPSKTPTAPSKVPPTPPTVPALPPSGSKLISLPLKGCPSSDYSTGISIGGQSFQVIVDSGSTTLAISSNKCSDCDDVSPSYKPGSSAKDSGNSVEGDYGSGAWVGEVYSDSVALGSSKKVTLAFGAIDDQKNFIVNNECDLTNQDPGTKPLSQGLLGVGPEALLLDGTTSYVGLTNSSWVAPAMSFALCDSGGTMWLGGYPSANTEGEALFSPMVDTGYYSIPMLGIGLNNTSSGANLNDLGYTVVDTGSTGIELPEPVYQAITQMLDDMTDGFLTQDFFDQGGCVQWTGATVDDVNSQLPPMTFLMLDSQNQSSSFFLNNGAAHSYLTVQNTGDNVVEACPILFNSGTGDTAQSLIGNTMMRNFMTVFDLENQQVGFQSSKGVCSAD